jgi:hypothetical protein
MLVCASGEERRSRARTQSSVAVENIGEDERV